MDTPETPYFKEKLEQDKAVYEEWANDEEQRITRVKDDEELKQILSVRIAMWRRNIVEINKALATLETADVMAVEPIIETDPGFISKELTA